MGSPSPQFSTTLSLAEMETLIRRIVKDAVHEEFARLLEQVPAIAADWTHKGRDDPEGDQLLLAEALAELERYRASPGEWSDWEALKAELNASEEAGELPD